MSNEMTEALHALAEDRGISIDKLFGIMANALESAYKRMPEAFEYSWVTIDPATLRSAPPSRTLATSRSC
jgi:N utilization substance protein A